MVTDERRAKGGEKDLARAILCGVDLTEVSLCVADLTNADLAGATLNRTDLTGADLRDARVADIGHFSTNRIIGCSSGWNFQMIAVENGSHGVSIQAGCRSFTAPKPLEWWASHEVYAARRGCAGDEQHWRETKAALDYLLTLAESRGWTIHPQTEAL